MEPTKQRCLRSIPCADIQGSPCSALPIGNPLRDRLRRGLTSHPERYPLIHHPDAPKPSPFIWRGGAAWEGGLVLDWVRFYTCVPGTLIPSYDVATLLGAANTEQQSGRDHTPLQRPLQRGLCRLIDEEFAQGESEAISMIDTRRAEGKQTGRDLIAILE